MALKTSEITIYDATYDNRVYVSTLSDDETKAALMSHYAFGKPENSPYAISDSWASTPEEPGWRIIQRRAQATCIKGEQRGEFNNDETVHLIWKCPFCERVSSEDLELYDKSPMLLSCDCNNTEKYLLVSF